MARLVVPERVRRFKVTIDGSLRWPCTTRSISSGTGCRELSRSAYTSNDSRAETRPYLAIGTDDAAGRCLSQKIDKSKRRTIDFLVDINAMLCQRTSAT